MLVIYNVMILYVTRATKLMMYMCGFFCDNMQCQYTVLQEFYIGDSRRNIEGSTR